MTLVLLAAASRAHGTPDNHLVVVVSETRIKMNIVVGDRVLSLADANRNGVVVLKELQAGRDRLNSWFNDAVVIRSSAGASPSIAFKDLTTDLVHIEASGHVDHARFRRTLVFDTAPAAIDLNSGGLFDRIPTLQVTVVNTINGERKRLRSPFQNVTLKL
ncbi:MAG: hypothetical protein AAF610_08060 [Pseudomonadota bacterium]